jgi:hypothetical protein
LIRWFLLQTLDRSPVDEDVDEFGLEGVAHIEGLGLVGTASRSGERSARAASRAGLVAAIHVCGRSGARPQALGDGDDPTPDAY